MIATFTCKKQILSLLTTLLVSVLMAGATVARADYEAQDGDIIFHRSCSAQSGAIAEATNSRYTHVGIIFIENGREMVYEASSTVRATPLQSFIKSGENGHYVIKRLKSTRSMNVASLKSEVKKMCGRRYDKYFNWSDSTIYCSELVWKAYERGCGVELGRLKQMKDFNLGGKLAKDTVKCRYGNSVPLDMKIIAPSDIYASLKLKTVDSDGGGRNRFTSLLGKMVGL